MGATELLWREHQEISWAAVQQGLGTLSPPTMKEEFFFRPLPITISRGTGLELTTLERLPWAISLRASHYPGRAATRLAGRRQVRAILFPPTKRTEFSLWVTAWQT